MKKTIFILTSILTIFTACNKSEDQPEPRATFSQQMPTVCGEIPGYLGNGDFSGNIVCDYWKAVRTYRNDGVDTIHTDYNIMLSADGEYRRGSADHSPYVYDEETKLLKVTFDLSSGPRDVYWRVLQVDECYLVMKYQTGDQQVIVYRRE